ncbi:SMP-30/gluconolactonase/LRE family protein [Paracoccus pantotrophus]|uniref:SMP-30/gluconolactonase/LRE family protein n=1 Tax=Paracoccus pantotrophus TaxID=82367 RepID=A0A7H9BPN9_PARPN|nr:SMP-30/gluconolactonase/LRE family protein [Paracoccus pantotrophus]QLH13019.1 SMP-30/gluconolactonase/LRE family protein [Paracoccus pantotrophus]
MLEIYDVVEKSFFDLVSPVIPPQEVYSGGLFTEGPAYYPAGRYLLFTDIPNDRILRFDEANGTVSAFRENCGHPNGQTIDRNGRLLSCEHRYRRVSRTEHDGQIVTIADAWQGKRLNSPNDVIVASDGAIWFTDPTYGILHDLDGIRVESEIGACHVYRVDPVTGAVEAKITDMVMPNGLAFSADESTLYVVDSGKSHFEDGPAHVRAFRVGANNQLSGGEVFADCQSGIFDGLRLDREGNLWIGAGDGVHCYSPGGDLLGRVRLGKIAGNLTFGGPRNNIMFICATNSVYRLPVKVNGLR